jgi:hypothetical protein
MKHLATIQREFVKEARKWNDLSLEDQKGYLKRHPGSKRKITAKPGKKEVSEKTNISANKAAQNGTTEQRIKFFQKALGSSFKPDFDNTLEFSKRGGYIDNLKKRVLATIKDLGFKRESFDSDTSPHNDIVNNKNIFKDEHDNTIEFYSHLGQTKQENSHRITLTVPKNQENTSIKEQLQTKKQTFEPTSILPLKSDSTSTKVDKITQHRDYSDMFKSPFDLPIPSNEANQINHKQNIMREYLVDQIDKGMQIPMYNRQMVDFFKSQMENYAKQKLEAEKQPPKSTTRSSI